MFRPMSSRSEEQQGSQTTRRLPSRSDDEDGPSLSRRRSRPPTRDMPGRQPPPTWLSSSASSSSSSSPNSAWARHHKAPLVLDAATTHPHHNRLTPSTTPYSTTSTLSLPNRPNLLVPLTSSSGSTTSLESMWRFSSSNTKPTSSSQAPHRPSHLATPVLPHQDYPPHSHSLSNSLLPPSSSSSSQASSSASGRFWFTPRVGETQTAHSVAATSSSTRSTSSLAWSQSQLPSQPPPTFEVTTADSTDPPASAASLAREAPQAGYLAKWGTLVPEFKRRFFVLQPGTHLYYFLSPSDTVPRGCLEIDGTWIEEMGTLADGRFRFALCWPPPSSSSSQTPHPQQDPHRVILEARSEEVGQAWIKSLQQERLSYVKQEWLKSQSKISAFQSRVAELELQLDHCRLVEKDRDGALEDARQWKQQFEQLDQALRRLVRHLPPSSRPTAALPRKATNHEQHEEEKGDDSAAITIHHSNQEHLSDDNGDSTEAMVVSEGQPTAQDASRDASLLDQESSGHDQLDPLTIPGRHFGSLFNACEQLRESLHLAAEEASSAVEDLTASQERVAALEKRMAKAEKHLCKLWEENCTLRKALKQKRREKRVLVREVKTLRSQASLPVSATDDLSSSREAQVPDDNSSTVMASEEEKLIHELEEHVMSSIRLHEQILGSKHHRPEPYAVQEVDPSGSAATSKTDGQATATGSIKLTLAASTTTPRAAPKALLSLFDDSDDGATSEGADDDFRSVAASLVSSIGAEASDTEALVDMGMVTRRGMNGTTSYQSTPERPNPLDLLDDGDSTSEQAPLCATSYSESSKSMVTNNGRATSKIACPLKDVAGEDQVDQDDEHELRVYHLTFYSRKIGLQFQRVPPPPVKPRGLLTEALTADMECTTDSGTESTAAELRRIASIYEGSRPRGGINHSRDVTLTAAPPVDAVLVCGFEGFDDSGTNVRPKLGARLVAFDGVSVEVGRWTFDSIRKAIQARGRPLTLSFRNDFLTTEQRAILTKATRETVLAPSTELGGAPESTSSRPSSTEPSLYSALSHETDRFVNDPRSTPTHDDDLSVSACGSDHRYSMPQSFSGARSVSSVHRNYRSSFSDAGSTSSVLSAVAPLVANLLGRKEPYTPLYLRQEAEAVESTPQHQDFQAELL